MDAVAGPALKSLSAGSIKLHYLQGGWLPSEQIAVLPWGTTTVVVAGGGGLLLLIQADSAKGSSKASIRVRMVSVPRQYV